jgi:hypothetical protein
MDVHSGATLRDVAQDRVKIRVGVEAAAYTP